MLAILSHEINPVSHLELLIDCNDRSFAAKIMMFFNFSGYVFSPGSQFCFSSDKREIIICCRVADSSKKNIVFIYKFNEKKKKFILFQEIESNSRDEFRGIAFSSLLKKMIIYSRCGMVRAVNDNQDNRISINRREIKDIVISDHFVLVMQAGVLALCEEAKPEWKLLRELPLSAHNKYDFSCCAISPNETQIVAGLAAELLSPTVGINFPLIVWDIASTRPLYRLTGHTDNITSCAFSPDGQFIVSGSALGHIKIWREGREILQLMGHSDRINKVIYSSDGRWIASVSNDETVRLWNARSGKQRGQIKTRTRLIDCKFSNDPPVLLILSADAKILKWSLG